LRASTLGFRHRLLAVLTPLDESIHDVSPRRVDGHGLATVA